MARLVGHVVSGRGWATGDLARHLDVLREETGCDLFPGTLNLHLRRPAVFDPGEAIEFGGGRRLLWPASMVGRDVWLYRWRRAPIHVVEVLADIRLRHHLGERQKVALEVEDRLLLPIRPRATLGWLLLYAGRGRWYYTSRRYWMRAARWERRFCAVQAHAGVSDRDGRQSRRGRA